MHCKVCEQTLLGKLPCQEQQSCGLLLSGCSEAACAVQLEDVLSWQCGHPQVRSMQTTSASKEAGEASGDLQLDVLSNLERHVDRLSAFSDEEDEAELHNLYMVRAQQTSQ